MGGIENKEFAAIGDFAGVARASFFQRMRDGSFFQRMRAPLNIQFKVNKVKI